MNLQAVTKPVATLAGAWDITRFAVGNPPSGDDSYELREVLELLVQTNDETAGPPMAETYASHQPADDATMQPNFVGPFYRDYRWSQPTGDQRYSNENLR